MKRSRCLAAVTMVAATLAAAPDRLDAQAARPTVIGPEDWRTYGHDSRHNFVGVTTLTPASVQTLAPAWFFPTGDTVTANPTVVAGTVYVGSWDGNFYAIDAATGRQRWKYTLKPQPAISPTPGEQPRDPASDGGLVTSSAWFEPGDGRRRPDLVIFGGGFTLYALVARTGALYWQRDYTGRPERPPNPAGDLARIFSSPVVVGDTVLFGVSVDGRNGWRGYAAAADLRTGRPVWRFETDVDERGRVLNSGCSGVWSSLTPIPKLGIAVFDTADCDFHNHRPYAERVIAVRIADGKRAWVFNPPRDDPDCDWDFGATPNLELARDGTPTFLGVGGKDGTYYSLDPRTGRLRWQRNVTFGGVSGGFIATTAYDGRRVYGATGIGDFGRFGGGGKFVCDQTNPRDTFVQEPSMHAFDARSGEVVWQGVQSQSFSPTTVANGMTFVGPMITKHLQIRDAADGTLLRAIPLPASSLSGIVVSGNALFFGTGSPEQGAPVGIYAFTPLGSSPQSRPGG